MHFFVQSCVPGILYTNLRHTVHADALAPCVDRVICSHDIHYVYSSYLFVLERDLKHLMWVQCSVWYVNKSMSTFPYSCYGRDSFFWSSPVVGFIRCWINRLEHESLNQRQESGDLSSRNTKTHQNCNAKLTKSTDDITPHCIRCYLRWHVIHIISSGIRILTYMCCSVVFTLTEDTLDYDDVIKWKLFRVTGHLCGEFTGHRWIPRTKACDAEPWCYLWSAPEWTVE